MRRRHWHFCAAALLLTTGGCAPWSSGLPNDPLAMRVPHAPAESTEPIEKASPAQPQSKHESSQPLAMPESPATSPPAASDTRVARSESLAPAPVDLEVGRASLEPSAVIPAMGDESGKLASEVAAQVGDTFISTRELKRALAERVRGDRAWLELPSDQKEAIIRDTLEYMINRAMVVQLARKELNKPKQWDTLKEHVEKQWQESELSVYLKRYHVQNEVELGRKMAEEGQSLDDVKQSYHLDQISRMYTFEKIRSKVEQPGFQEIYRYYRENLGKYQRPAEQRWREIFFSTDETHDRATARAEADAALERLKNGEDFETLARTLGRGPKAVEGGLWVLAPGAFASAPVNQTLEGLNPGQTSNVVEDLKGFYIVRLESRREAGPIPFEEIQGKIGEALLQHQTEKAIDTFLADVRKRVPVKSRFLDQQTK